MIRIAITAEAFAAIRRTLPVGNVAFEPEIGAKGQRRESYSDVILRLAHDVKP